MHHPHMTKQVNRHTLPFAVAAALVACSNGDEKPAAAPSKLATAATAGAVKASEPAALKAAWIYIGPITDSGSTYAHDQGRKAVQNEFRHKVQTTFVERVPEGSKAEGAIRNLAAQGNKVIFATNLSLLEPMLKVAAEFPDVKFENVSGLRTTDNLRGYDANLFEAAYMAGVIAGKMTTSNVLGFVGSVPAPGALQNVNAFTLGALSVNPKIRTKVAWINAWFNPQKEGEAAQNLIDFGADVLLQDTDSTAVVQTAERNGKYAFGWKSDMSAFAPKAHLASCIVNWDSHYKSAIQNAINGNWTTGRIAWGFKERLIAVVKISNTVPTEVRSNLEQIRASLEGGSFSAFTGPIFDNAGKKRLAAGALASRDWIEGMDFLVKGVDAK